MHRLQSPYLFVLATPSFYSQGWFSESMKLQESDPNNYGKVSFDHKLVYPIHHDLFDVPYNETRLMAPSVR